MAGPRRAPKDRSRSIAYLIGIADEKVIHTRCNRSQRMSDTLHALQGQLQPPTILCTLRVRENSSSAAW